MPTSREIDENGYLTVRGNPISSFGIFDYSAGQLGLPGDPMRIVKVYRPEEAVNDPAAIESFKNVPFIIEHAMLSGEEGMDDDEQGIVAPEAKGLDGVLTGNVYYEAPWMRGDIKVFSRKARRAIDKGMTDLSLGYGCRFINKSGTWNGQPYEVVQTDLRGNHIALVPEGRVPGARVLDARVFDSKTGEVGVHTVIIEERITLEGNDMKTKRTTAMDNAVQQLLGLIPALKQYLEQEATEPAHQEGAEAGQAGAAATGAEGAAGAEGTGAAAAQATGEGEGDGAFGAEGGAEGAAGAAGEAGAEGAGAGGAPDLGALITQIEGCLSQLKAMAGGAAQDNNDEEGQPGAGAAGATQDAVEGLQNEGHNATVAADSEGSEGGAVGSNNGQASAGPAAGAHATASDAALSAFYADLAAKDRLYNGISQVVGAFDHKAMDARGVAAYGLKKLGLKGVAAGQEVAAMDLWLQGRANGAKNTVTPAAQAKVGDGKTVGFVQPQRGTGDAGLDAYLKGPK